MAINKPFEEFLFKEGNYILSYLLFSLNNITIIKTKQH